jgi:hypothetical protein
VWRGDKNRRWPFFLLSAMLLAGSASAQDVQVELRDVNNALIRGTVYIISSKNPETTFDLEKGAGPIHCSDPDSVVWADAGPRHFLLGGQVRKPCSGTVMVFTFQIRRAHPRGFSSGPAPQIDRGGLF